MNFSEAIEEVLSITKRPDKTDAAASQLNKAIALFTLKSNFKLDLVEATVAVDSTLFGDTVDITDWGFTRFRKFKYIKPTGKRYYLKFVDPEQIFTPSGEIQRNRFYVAGNNLTYTLTELAETLEVGYYQYAPVLTEVEDNNTHWMLDLMPYAVIEKAAAQVFKSIGDDTSARFYEASSMEFFLAARRDFEDLVADSAT